MENRASAKPSLALWLATWGGCGYFPKSPGSAGSLGGIAVAWLIVGVAGWPPPALALLAVIFLLPAVWASNQAIGYWQTKDPQKVVIDEVLGQWITLAAAPGLDWRYWLGGFVAFRVFDIWKPFPARSAEALPGGWGIVTDDIVAGVYGGIVLLLFRQLNF